MATVRQFEDLHVWQTGQALAKEIFALCLTKRFAKEYVLTDQLRRAALSIPTNIAEGFERGTRSELIHYCYIAKGSAGELRSLLAFAFDAAFLSPADYEHLREMSLSLSRQLTRFAEHLKRTQQEIKGVKFTIPKPREKV